VRYISDLTSDVQAYTKEQKDILLYAVNRQWGSPIFKIDNFVGNAQYTPFGKLRQFLLELGSRENAIIDHEFNLEKTKLQIELELEMKDQTESPVQKKIHDLNVKELQRKLSGQRVTVSLAYEERDKYMLLITKFNESEEGKLPDGRLIMDIIGDTEEEERLEAELWATRLGAQAGYDLMFYGKVNNGNMEAIDQLPDNVRMLAIENAVSKAITNSSTIQSIENKVIERLALNSVEKDNWVEIE